MSSLDSYYGVKSLFVLGITTSAFCSGGLLFTSYLHVPAYVKNSSDESLITQWQTMGAVGKFVVPPLAVIAAGANLLNSYSTRSQPQHYRFMAAGALSLAVLPYTALALGSTNAEFGSRATGKNDSPDPELNGLELKELIQRWSTRSAIRGFMLLASAFLSCDAMLHITF
ncbi:hypothetical protein MMC25_001103 [Agyrium rufum]|nr:hypothetical protein [Agyrium rufum]